MNLAYLRILQRAWDRYDMSGQSGPRTPRSRIRATEEAKVAHLTSFMRANKLTGIVIKDYEDQVKLVNGNMATYTRWLMDGRLPSVKPGELIDFYTARWAANKVVKREVTHVDT